MYKCISMAFFSRNNGYAISTPVMDQYRGDGVGMWNILFNKASMQNMHISIPMYFNVYCIFQCIMYIIKLFSLTSKFTFVEHVISKYLESLKFQHLLFI